MTALTPRTDALLVELYGMGSPLATPKLTMIEHARQLERENARLAEWQAKVQEAEGRVCPEDVGFEEYIRHLLAKLALAAEDAAGRDDEYICKCGIRVVPHRCQTGQDF